MGQGDPWDVKQLRGLMLNHAVREVLLAAVAEKIRKVFCTALAVHGVDVQAAHGQAEFQAHSALLD